MSEPKKKKLFELDFKPLLIGFLVLFALMVIVYVLTFVLQPGEFDRVLVDGQETIVEGSFHAVEGGIPFWRFIASPILVLGDGPNGGMIVLICLFLIIIGGTFTALDEYGILGYALGLTYSKFKDKKYRLLWITTLFIMLLGAVAGTFEEITPLIPLGVALAYTLGWDAMVGLGMTFLAVGCGFASGVFNFFNVGMAQTIAGIPLFSGLSMRILTLVLVYFVTMFFLHRYAKKIEADPTKSIVYDAERSAYWKSVGVSFDRDARKSKALLWFALLMALMVLTIIVASFIPVLQDFVLVFVVVEFFAAGTVAVLVAGMKFKHYAKTFISGALSILPIMVFILMANAVRFILTDAKVLDTVLYEMIGLTSGVPSLVVLFIIYLLVLIMELFIPGSTLKAFLLIPLIVPIALANNISAQQSVLAFAFGDGFSNMFYPTNSGVLICLGMAGVSFGKWFRWTALYQVILLIVTLGVLTLAFATGYGF